MKEPSFSDNPGHKPNSGSSLCQTFSDVLLLQCSLTLDCFRMATAALTFPYGNFPVSLFPGAASSSSHPLLVTLPSTTSHLSLYRFPSVLKTRCPLLCHPVFSLQWCSHQGHQGLVSGHQQGCCWGHLLLGSWEWRVQALSTGPLFLQYKTKH